MLQTFYNLSIIENTPANTEVLSLSAVDRDSVCHCLQNICEITKITNHISWHGFYLEIKFIFCWKIKMILKHVFNSKISIV